MFDVDELVTDCRAALAEGEPRLAIRDVLRKALERPTEVGDVLRPESAGITLLHRADDLTVLHAVWAPGMRLFPHDHQMWAAIGIYSGQEDNAYFRRTNPGQGDLTDSGGTSLTEGEVLLLGDDAIHAVSNPLTRLTGAIHIYGGDFVDHPRSQWGPGPVVERPYEFASVQEEFAKANRAWLGEDADA
jgi:predicted metal-dependent enzyme (double-stranded beta helix superfamily)